MFLHLDFLRSHDCSPFLEEKEIPFESLNPYLGPLAKKTYEKDALKKVLELYSRQLYNEVIDNCTNLLMTNLSDNTSEAILNLLQNAQIHLRQRSRITDSIKRRGLLPTFQEVNNDQGGTAIKKAYLLNNGQEVDLRSAAHINKFIQIVQSALKKGEIFLALRYSSVILSIYPNCAEAIKLDNELRFIYENKKKNLEIRESELTHYEFILQSAYFTLLQGDYAAAESNFRWLKENINDSNYDFEKTLNCIAQSAEKAERIIQDLLLNGL